MKKWVLTVLCSLVFFFTPVTAYAADVVVDEERIESIEDRLNSYGSSIQEIKDRLAAVDSALEAQYENDLTMMQQLDVLIVGVDSVFQELASFHTEFSEHSALLLGNLATYKDDLAVEIQGIGSQIQTLNSTLLLTNTSLDDMALALSEQIATSQEATLTELNETLLVTNNLLVYLFCTLVIVLIVVIGSVLYKLIHGTLIKNIF